MEITEQINQLPICKIKYGTWRDFQPIGNLPRTFSDFIKIVSSIVFPFNFSIFYFSEDFLMIPIASSNTYKDLLKFAQKNESMKEVKIFVILHENENGSEFLSEKASKKYTSSKPKKNNIPSDINASEGSDESLENEAIEEKSSKKFIQRSKNKKPSRKTNRGIQSVCIQCY